MKKAIIVALLLLPPAAAVAEERFACNMKALSTVERARHQELTRQLLAGAQERTELENGFAFRLPAPSLVSAAEWVALEHRCCPFFTFALEQTRDAGPVWLRITGSDGVKKFIRAELGI